jgi:predicted ATPase
MVGRDAEWDELQAALAATVAGRGSAVAVTGPPGIGKSRLVADFTRWARDGAAVFTGRCVEDGSPPALRPLTEALLSGLRSAHVPAGADLDPFLPALSRVLPFWPTAPRPLDTSPIVLAEGIIRLLDAAAGRAPAILVVEDLQWADPDSLAVLEYVVDNVAPTRLLVVVTARAIPGSARTVLRRLATRGILRHLVLPALTDEEMQSMAVACLGEPPSPGLLELLRDRADGFPLLIEELLGADPSTQHTSVVPTTVAEVTAAKMTTLDVHARTLVRAAAMLGVRFDWDILASIVDHEPTGMIDALRAAVDADLVVELAEGGFAFRHALTRDAVLATTLQPERTIIARRAWEAFKLGEGAQDSAWRGQAAEFAALAGEAEAAVTLLHTSARLDLERGSLATAEATLRRARALALDATQIVAT